MRSAGCSCCRSYHQDKVSWPKIPYHGGVYTLFGVFGSSVTCSVTPFLRIRVSPTLLPAARHCPLPSPHPGCPPCVCHAGMCPGYHQCHPCQRPSETEPSHRNIGRGPMGCQCVQNPCQWRGRLLSCCCGPDPGLLQHHRLWCQSREPWPTGCRKGLPVQPWVHPWMLP